MTAALTLSVPCLSQTHSSHKFGKWGLIHLEGVKNVYMPLEDYNVISAKRAISDHLNLQRAQVITRYESVIVAYQKSEKEYEAQAKELIEAGADFQLRMEQAIDANMGLQKQLSKMRTFATVGKITVVVTIVVIVAGGVSYIVKTYQAS